MSVETMDFFFIQKWRTAEQPATVDKPLHLEPTRRSDHDAHNNAAKVKRHDVRLHSHLQSTLAGRLKWLPTGAIIGTVKSTLWRSHANIYQVFRRYRPLERHES